MPGKVQNSVEALTGHVCGPCHCGGCTGGRAWCQNAAKKPPPCQIGRVCVGSPLLPLCWRYALQARSRRAQPLGHGLPALNQTLAARRTVTGTAVGAGQLHPVTVVLTCLLNYPVGAQCMQTGYNAHSAGRTATCHALACQNQTAVHHMGCGLWYRQCFVWTGGNALTAMVADVGVKAQAIVIMRPGGTWADVDTGLAAAVRNALVHTAFGMDGQGRVRRCSPCVCAHVA